jgi:hypothetical protein
VIVIIASEADCTGCPRLCRFRIFWDTRYSKCQNYSTAILCALAFKFISLFHVQHEIKWHSRIFIHGSIMRCSNAFKFFLRSINHIFTKNPILLYVKCSVKPSDHKDFKWQRVINGTRRKAITSMTQIRYSNRMSHSSKYMSAIASPSTTSRSPQKASQPRV